VSLSNVFDYYYFRLSQQERPYKLFGWFGVITYPLYHFLWGVIYQESGVSTDIGLRLIATLLCTLLVFVEQWPKALRQFLPIFWYITILYCLPFLFSFFLMEGGITCSDLINSSTILFLTLLLLNPYEALIIMLIGGFLGWLLHRAMYQNTVVLYELEPSVLISCISFFLFAWIFSFSRNKILKAKVDGMRSISGVIAHELRTPLTSIKQTAHILNEKLPVILEKNIHAEGPSQQYAKSEKNYLKKLLMAARNIETESKYSLTIIDMLLVNLGNQYPYHKDYVYATETLFDAINRYPFRDKIERALIEVDMHRGKDFVYYGNSMLLQHVVFNLIKNAIYEIKKQNKGCIKIWLENHFKYNELHVYNDASGIDEENYDKIFQRFYTSRRNSSGLGLYICKIIMHEMKGDIFFNTDHSRYVEFVVQLPKVTMISEGSKEHEF